MNQSDPAKAARLRPDLDAIDVRMLPNLRVLRCSDNRLRELELGSATLQELDCSGNQLMVLDLRGCAALRVLDCSAALPDEAMRDIGHVLGSARPAFSREAG